MGFDLPQSLGSLHQDYCLYLAKENLSWFNNVLVTLHSLYEECKLQSTSTSSIVSSSPIVSGSGMIVLMIIIFLMVEDLDNKWGDRTLIYNWGSWLFS